MLNSGSNRLKIIVAGGFLCLTIAIPSFGAAPMSSSSVSETCIGRFSINWPAKATVNPESTFQGASLSSVQTADHLADLKTKLKAKADSLRKDGMKRDDYSDKILRSGGLDPDSMYSKNRLIDYSNDGHTFVIGYHKDDEKSDFQVDLHKWASGKDYIFESKGPSADQYDRTRQSLTRAASSFHPLEQGALPSAHGFCTNNGIYTQEVQPSNLSEEFTLVAHFPAHPGTKLIIDSRALAMNAPAEEPLKDRVDGELRMIKAAGGDVSVLERGNHQAVGQNGYEVALAIHNDGSYKFFWSAQGVNGDATRPALEINLVVEPTEDQADTFHDDAEALAFWRSLLVSIKIRS